MRGCTSPNPEGSRDAVDIVLWHHVVSTVEAGEEEIGMPVYDREALKLDLKRLVTTECEKDVDVDEIDDDDFLIGGPLELDSLDALQICMEVKNRYGVRIEGGPEARRALQSINALADTILGFTPEPPVA
jgi:acyl carrier protein